MFSGADVGEENMVAEQMNNIYKESPTIVIIYSTPKSMVWEDPSPGLNKHFSTGPVQSWTWK